MKRLLRTTLGSPHHARQFALYVTIGGLGVAVDLLSLAALLRVHVLLVPAVTLAFAASVAVHFTLNKYYNFRNHDRPIARQAGTYLVVASSVWLLTVLWIEFFVRYFGVSVMVAKVSVLPLNVVIGYFGTRFLAFGPGIGRSVRAWLARRSGVSARDSAQ